jgi:rhodanese-related sulfurtransferase
MKSVFQIAILFAISASAASVSWLTRDTTPKPIPVPLCNSSLLKEGEICFHQAPENVLWIDARTRKEWEKDGYPNSILWNLDPKEDANKMEADAVFKIAESKFIVIYCTSQACGTSKEIAKKIRKLDFGAEVKTLYGGYPSLVFKKQGDGSLNPSPR